MVFLKRIKQKKYFPRGLVFLSIILLMMSTFNITGVKALLFLVCLFLISNPVSLLPVYLISSLSSDYFIFSDGIGISRILTVYIIVSCVIYYIRFRIRFDYYHLLILILLLFFLLFSSLTSLTGSMHAFTQFSMYFFIVLLFSSMRGVDIEEFSKVLLISSLIAFTGIVFYIGSDIELLSSQRLSLSEDINSNRFGMMLAQLGTVFYIAFLQNNRKRVIQFFYLGVFLVVLFYMILSGSRSAIIGVLFSLFIVIMYMYYKKKKKPGFQIFIIGIFLSLLFSVLLNLDLPVLDRYSIHNIVESGGANRFYSWEKMIPSVVHDKPYFGVGFGAANVIYYAKQFGLYHPAHNIIFDLLLQVGFIGMLGFILYFIYVNRKIRPNLSNKYLLLPLALVMTSLFNGVGETIFSEKLFWNNIALLLLVNRNILGNEA